MHHPLSLAHLTIDRASPLELIDAAAAAGFDSVGLRVISAAGIAPRPPAAGDAAQIAALRQRLSETGVSALQVNSFWISPETTVQNFAPVLEAAVSLGAGHVLVVINNPDLARGAAVFAECCALAKAQGVRIGLEFQTYGIVRSLEHTRDIIRESGQENAGVVLDMLHFFRTGGRVSDLARPADVPFAFVHFCDAPLQGPPPDQLRVESRNRRLYPGEGEFPLFDVLDALPAGVPLEVEAPSERHAGLPFAEQARCAAEATRRFLAAYDARRA